VVVARRVVVFVFAMLFDVDGLLFDTEPLWKKAEQAVARALGFGYTDADNRALIGVDLKHTAEYLASRGDGKHDAAWAERELQLALREMAREDPPELLPGAASLLNDAKLWGIPHALVTSSPRWFLRSVLDARKMKFEHLVSAENTGKHKPHPAPYELAVSRLRLAGHNVTARDCAVFEDSPVGVVSALDAGCGRVYAVPSGAPVPHEDRVTVLKTLEEVTATPDGVRLACLSMRP
jgi:HAD superfamily hydrolase (TIGR01509 family)